DQQFQRRRSPTCGTKKFKATISSRCLIYAYFRFWVFYDCTFLDNSTGPSGCGKSTIIRLINGLIPNYYEGKIEGKVSVDGETVSDKLLYELAGKMGTVFQNPRSQFFNVDTTSELAFLCENMGMEKKDIISRIEDTVNGFGIEKLIDRDIFGLSGGEKQKIACASIDVAKPELILMDEPSANLDAAAIQDLRKLLKIWKEQKKTVIIAEHRIAYLWDMIDRVVILKNGVITKDIDRSVIEKMTAEDVRKLGLRSNVSEDPMSIKLNAPKAEDKIVIRDLKYAYEKGNNVLDIKNLEIPCGQISAVIGRNGAGKTTFLNCFTGILKNKGIMSFEGKDYKSKERLKQVFMVMQDVNHQLFAESVLEEVMISMPDENKEKAMEILASLDLAEYAERHPMSLSGGQKQRVAIACAVASGRKILVFDEPSSGLDYEHMMLTAEIMRKLKNSGKTVLIVTHDDELIRECCENVIRI
ncbi:ABC transporter ATP-binding protein, partial [Ruminococcus flavefaciens]|uniref:ABC transporter ATP-binding protein n=1 Tax=Ruminococcus flavefaciens TaxID=1265 RepID=UPI0026EBF08A